MLNVKLYGTHLGWLHQANKTGSKVDFKFSPDTISRWGYNSPIVSSWVKITDSVLTDIATVFFASLLPEGPSLA